MPHARRATSRRPDLPGNARAIPVLAAASAALVGGGAVHCAAVLAAAGFAFAATSAVHAQPTWPARPLRMLIPYTPGGSTDLLARAVGTRLGEGIGQPVVFDNRPGANTIVGFELQARAAPDGYTVLAGGFNGLVLNPLLYRRLPYDVDRDLAPVGMIGVSPLMVVVHPSLPIRSVRDLIDYARANPGRLDFQSSGNGNITHVSVELFMSMTGTRMQHVAFKGGSAGVPDLLSGAVPLKFDVPISALPHVKAGKLRAIAVTSARRLSIAPELPTIAESGLAGYEAATWFSLVTRAGTPTAIVDRLSRETRRIVEQPELREQFAQQAIELVGSSPVELQERVRCDRARWTDVIRKAGIALEP